MEAHPVPGILSKKGAYARIMEWSMKDPAFKAQLFRFVDVLPALSSSSGDRPAPPGNTWATRPSSSTPP